MAMFKLALKNITSKPMRFVATTLAVAVVVAMIFCMISFKGAVFDYIYATETASAGVSDITISTNSTSDRIMKDDPLQSVEGIEQIVPSLKLYAMYGEEYVGVRGFKKGQLETLAKIEIVEGDIAKLQSGERRYNRIARCGKTFRIERGRQGGVCARNEKSGLLYRRNRKAKRIFS